jgi:HK97 gp10 family phage protein
MDVSGLKEVIDALHVLPQKVEKKVVKGAVRAGSRPISRQITKNIKLLTKPHKNILCKSVTKREVTYKKDGAFVVVVGPSGKKKAKHAHLLEYGTEPRWHWGKLAKEQGRIKWRYGREVYLTGSSKGRYTGIGPKIPFATFAFQHQKGRAERIIKDRLVEGVLTEATNLGKKSKAA